MISNIVKVFIKGHNESSCILVRNTSFIEKHEGKSNNECEWWALLMAIKYIHDNNIPNGVIYTDSALLFKHINGTNRIKAKKLRHIYYKWNYYKNILKYEKDIVIEYRTIDGSLNPARCYV